MMHSTGNQLVRPQWRGGPLADWLDAFADLTAARGYAPSTSHRMILLASCFSQWLKQEAIAIADINPDHATRYLRHRAQRLRPRQHDRTSLRHFLDFLQREGVLSFEDAPTDPLTDAERCVQAYERYLQQTRGLAPTTRATYVPFVRSFLHHRFDSGPVTLSSVDADDVVRFVRHMAPGLRPKRAKLLATALRSFLRYACHLGEVGPELGSTKNLGVNQRHRRARAASSHAGAPLIQTVVHVTFFSTTHIDPQVFGALLEDEPFHLRALTLISTRTDFFDERLNALNRLFVEPRRIDIGSYDFSTDGEFDQKLELASLSRDEFPDHLIEHAAVPRMFDLIKNLRSRLGSIREVTVHRLLWE